MTGRFEKLRLGAAGIALLVLAPLLVVISALFTPTGDIWSHLAHHVLPELLVNTAWLVAGVAVLTVLLGVSLAWLTSMYHFPGRKFFVWALMLPLALPSYVLAFVAVDLLDYSGPVQVWLRDFFNGAQIWFPPIRSRGGVIVVMALAFYPYVYLMARQAFLTQGLRVFEAAQSLGHSRMSALLRVALPMARPWIVTGVMLVLMETLADFGTVAIFNYNTFTTAIYEAWFALFSLPTAEQLASILTVIALALLMIETFSRQRMRYYAPGRAAAHMRLRLTPPNAWLATAFCTLVFAIAFFIPVTQVFSWAKEVAAEDLDAHYWEMLWHSVLLAVLTAIVIIIAATVLAAAARRHRDRGTQTVVRIATLGYAIPGAVLAVGIFIPMAWLDGKLADWFGAFGIPVQDLLAGTILAMLLGYTIRFLAAGFGPVESAMQRITPSVEDAARGFGVGRIATWRAVYLPMLSKGMLTAAILVFVDVMKEMPITLMTRPFGWDTMAIQVFQMTAEGLWQRAALPAAAIVAVAFVFIAGLMYMQERNHAS